MSTLRRILSGDTNTLVGQLMQTNPQFAQFVAVNGSKSPEQAFRDNGFDFAEVQRIMQS